ncbi:hypothetical protein WMF31_14160 [Sorangium sp. So ce1036]|uniref:hypothetical protein n=1 Tax=Sorangium sp. So ce1036 TaxID=3133328 RepID=UPI003F03F188
MLAPACTILLNRTQADEEAEDQPVENAPAERPDEDSEAGDASEIDVGDEPRSPEEQAYDELLSVDPQEFTLKTMATSYAAVMVASLIEGQVPDPASINEESFAAMVDHYAPGAGEAARLWSETPEALAMASDYMIPDFSCMNEPYGCPYTTECPYNGGVAVCMITSCGDAQCPWCPWELGNLVFKSWCSYGCMRNGQMVAGAYILVSTWWGAGSVECIYW